MPGKRKSVEDKLSELERLDSVSDGEALPTILGTALKDRHYRVVAKAAELAAERLLHSLEPDLLDAYTRFLRDPVKRDPNCIAKRSIAKALADLACNNVSFFLTGVHYRQLEPVWGGTVDTAVPLRCHCAAGLVATGYPRALHELTALLNDEHPNARIGAVKAITCGHGREAELLLRYKAQIGDDDPEVQAEALSALLDVEPDESVPFVAALLHLPEETNRELAALALGESRLPSAFEALAAVWEDEVLPSPLQIAVIRGMALHRSDEALDWLLETVRGGNSGLMDELEEALLVHGSNATRRKRIRRAFEKRGASAALARLDESWQ